MDDVTVYQLILNDLLLESREKCKKWTLNLLISLYQFSATKVEIEDSFSFMKDQITIGFLKPKYVQVDQNKFLILCPL